MSRPKMSKMYCGDGYPNHPDWSDLGGGTYTAGDGITITSGKIAADPDGTTIGINGTSKKLECLVDPGPTYTAGDGIDITEGAISVDVDGTSVGINESGELECLVDPGPTYTAGDGIAIDQGAISADVDGTTIGINSTTKKLECLVSGGGGVDYSTTETDTGLKWIDNSTVYQKVVLLGSLSTTEQSIQHNISNLGHVISVECVANINGGNMTGHRVPIPQVMHWTNSPKINIDINDTYIMTKSAAAYPANCYAILRYTKATTP